MLFYTTDYAKKMLLLFICVTAKLYIICIPMSFKAPLASRHEQRYNRLFVKLSQLFLYSIQICTINLHFLLFKTLSHVDVDILLADAGCTAGP